MRLLVLQSYLRSLVEGLKPHRRRNWLYSPRGRAEKFTAPIVPYSTCRESFALERRSDAVLGNDSKLAETSWRVDVLNNLAHIPCHITNPYCPLSVASTAAGTSKWVSAHTQLQATTVRQPINQPICFRIDAILSHVPGFGVGGKGAHTSAALTLNPYRCIDPLKESTQHVIRFADCLRSSTTLDLLRLFENPDMQVIKLSLNQLLQLSAQPL